MNVLITQTPEGSMSFTVAVNQEQLDKEKTKLSSFGRPVFEITHEEYVRECGDTTFRAAWKVDVSKPAMRGFDLEKGREIAKNRIRALRSERLAILDTDYMRALEANEGTEVIVAEKQRLRDITNDKRLADASNEAELKQAMNEMMNQI